MTLFASLTQDYVRLHGLVPDGRAAGRMVAIVGDAELDEGNIFEALLEGWKHDVRNLWWVIDYNRQSLDRVVPERLFAKIEQFFATVGWRVVTHQVRQEAAGGVRAARAARRCATGSTPARTTSTPPCASRAAPPGGRIWRAISAAIPASARCSTATTTRRSPQLMTNLGGHDLEAMLEAFHGVADDRPHCFIAYTVKGWGLPFAGHKDNHAGLMTPEQMAASGSAHTASPTGEEWSRSAGLEVGARAARRVPGRRAVPPPRSSATTPRAVPVPGQPAAGPPQPTRLDPGGVRADHGRARAQRPAAGARASSPPRPTSRSRPVSAAGSAGASVFNRREHEDVFRAEQVVSPHALAREPRRASISSSASPRTTCSSTSPASGLAARAVRRPAAAGRHALRPVHRARPRCAELCLLPGRPLPPGGHAVGHHAGARRAARTSRSARR